MHTYTHIVSLLTHVDVFWLSWIGSCNNFITQVLPQMILADIISAQANLFQNCVFHADEYVLTFYFQGVSILALEVMLESE